nr:DUF2860 family protein [Vibrio crassostreae]
MRFVLPVVFSAFASMPAYSGLAPMEGFSGNFSVLTGVSSDSSNLSTEQDANQATNTKEGDSENQGLLGFLGTVQYTFGESLTHQVYAGTTREDIATGTIAFEIGYRYQLSGGTILDFSVLPTLISGKAWTDPYAVGVNRNETDVKGNVGRLQLTNIGGTGFRTDLAFGQSEGHPPEKFKRVFQQAKQAGFLTVAHAGEEGPAQNIVDAIEMLSVSRVDHGVQCMTDEALIAELIETKMPLTVCPLSNIKLRVFDEMEDHNIVELLRRGVAVTINSDDPAYFGGYMSDNFNAVSLAHEMTEQELAQFTLNAIEASFIEESLKQQYRDVVLAYLA